MMGISWSEIWYSSLAFLIFLVVSRLFFFNDYKRRLSPAFSSQIVSFFIVLIALFFASEPIILYSDKWLYQKDFYRISNGMMFEIKDAGFYFYTKLISLVTGSSEIYFFLTALLYLTGFYIFAVQKIDSKYRLLLFLAFVSGMGFYSYGNNTIRAGLALSLFLVVMSRPYLFNFSTLVMLVIVLALHKSLLLPLAALLISLIYRRSDHFFTLWMVCLLLSLFAGEGFVGLFGEFFSFADARVTEYTTTTVENYKTGFRWDFVLFSLFPILLAKYYMKQKYKDPLYSQLLSMYIISNAFWLLLIRMPFSDRMATLSWFLIPVLIMYPLLTKRIFEKQHFWIAGVLLVNMLITFTLNMK